MADELAGLRIGYAMTGSFCTFKRSFEQAERLKAMGAELIPIMSEHAAGFSTRFGTAEENITRLEAICGKRVILSIADAEPIGPKDMTDLMIVAPCTSNTAAKLAAGICDGCVTMSVKSHLRSGKPVLLAIASNDAMAASAKNIGELFNRRNYYFVPMVQDDVTNKPSSLVADLSRLPEAVIAAVKGVQLRPVIAV